MQSETSPFSLNELRTRFNAGERFKFVHFWGHRASRDGSVTQSCFSQWFPSPFTVEGVAYPTAEHYMMAAKARLFADDLALPQILDASSPAAAKKLGRSVRDFDEAVWIEHRFEIVKAASIAKFGQNNAMGEFLLATNHRVLVEASPVDRVWGIGFEAKHPDASNPNLWKGLNLLGFALMAARETLRGVNPGQSFALTTFQRE